MFVKHANAITAEGMTAGQRDRFLVVVVVGLKTNAALENAVDFLHLWLLAFCHLLFKFKILIT
jgi:hypothetical protein